LPINPNWAAPERKSFPALPEDTYQVVIKDAELQEGKAFQSDDIIDQIKFTFEIVGGEFSGRKLWKQVNPVISAGGPNKKPANFNLLYEAVYNKTPYADQLTKIDADLINAFIGKELRLIVRQTPGQDGLMRNKIDGYLKLKVTKDEAMAEALGLKSVPKNEDDDIDDVNAELAGQEEDTDNEPL
jgi:hypothetical protein